MTTSRCEIWLRRLFGVKSNGFEKHGGRRDS